MNRGRSSDSLDNGTDGFVYYSSSGSSSPTDFTSDDETSADNLYMMSGQPVKPKALASSDSRVKNSNYPPSQSYNYQPHNLLQPTTSYPLNRRPTDQLNYANPYSLDQSMNPSTSRHVPTLPITTTGLSSLISDSSTLASHPDHIRNNDIENINSQLRPNHRDMRRNRVQSQRSTFSNVNLVEGPSNKRIIDPSGVVLNITNPTHDAILEPASNFISGAGRGMNTITVRMCSRLLECRNLVEAIEFVEQQRDLIENLTRIITREAPAFRDYDLGNYQTDYSVKDSFNPNFWLDREPVVTTADGNCQYHAVSISLTGTESYTPEVRLATAVSVIDHRDYFDSMLKLIDRGSVLGLVHTIARSYSWGDETTLKAIAVAINRRIFLYTCNIGKKDYEMVKLLSKEELLDAFKEKKYRGGTGIHTYADPLTPVSASNYIMLFHKSEHFIAVLPTCQQLTMFEPYNPIVPVLN